MKLVKIKHFRCDEIEGFTLLWAPDDKTEEDFANDVDGAVEEYLNVKKNYNANNPKPIYLTESFSLFPEVITIKEAKGLIEKSHREWDKWQDDKNKVSKDFIFYMRKRGYIDLGDADVEDTWVTTAYWGHNHGEKLDMSLTVDYNRKL